MASEDIGVLIARLKEFRDTLPEVLPDVAKSVSLTGKAMSERIIKDKGFGKLYSETKVPAWFMEGKALNNSGNTYIKSLQKAATEDEPATTTWGDFRKAQGLQDKYVDLTYSGKMWAGMFPQDVQVNLFTYIAPLGNNSKEGQEKMNYNFERYGDFIGKVITGDVLDAMYNVAYDELVRLIDERLGWKKG